MIVRTRTIRFSESRTPDMRRIRLGFEGDNMVERLEFVLPVISEEQTAVLMTGGAYANAVVLIPGENGRYGVNLTAELVGTDGEIEAYVRMDGSGGEVWQSGVMRLVTGEVPDVETEIETRFPTAVDQMMTEMAGHRGEMAGTLLQANEAAERAEAAAEKAESTGGGIVMESDPTVPAWAKQPTKPGYTADEVGALSVEALPGAVNEALAQAKASGAFDGAPGPQGVSGVHYGTEEPADGNVRVWVNPEGTADLLPPATKETLGGVIVGDGLTVDADGRVSMEPEGEYELLRSITVTDDTVIEYMITNLCLDAVRTTMLAPASGFKNNSNGYQTAFFTKGGSLTVGGTCIQTSYAYGTRLDTYKAKRLWEAEALFGGVSTGTSTIAGPGRVDNLTPATEDDYIASVRVYTWNTDGCGYPKGTVINIYGVRHNG